MKKKSAIAAIAAFAVGVGIGFLAATVVKQAGPRLGSAPELALPAIPTAPLQQTPVAGPASEPTPSPPHTGTNTVFQDLIAAVKIDTPQPVQGTGVIHGTILTDDDQPVEGVLVTAVPNSIPSSRDPFSARSRDKNFELERSVRRTIRRHLLQKAFQKETVTDKTGAYTISGLEKKPHRLRAYLEKHDLIPTPQTQVYSVTPDAEINFVARPLMTIACAVVTPSGKQADIATIRWQSKERDLRRGWTPENSSVYMAQGSYRVTARGGDNNEFQSEPQDVTVSETSPKALNFYLQEKPGIKGRVILAKGYARHYVHVSARKLVDDEIPDAATFSRSSHRAWTGPFNGYAYVIKNLPEGEYAVAVLGNQYPRRMLAYDTVTVPGAMVERDIHVALPPRADYLRIWAYGPNNKLLPTLTCTVSARPGKGKRPGEFSHGKCADGSFWVLHPDMGNDSPPKSSWLTADSHRYGKRTIEYERTEAAEVTLKFDDPASLAVQVHDMPDIPGTKIELSLRSAGQNTPAETRIVPKGGSLTFKGLATGQYDLTLSSRQRRARWFLGQETLTIESGINETKMRVPQLHSLAVVAPDPALGEHIHLTLKDNDHGWISDSAKLATDTRRIDYEALPAGNYAIKMNHGERTGRIDITLPGESRIEFDPLPLNGIEIFAVKPDGYLAQAGFQSGDIIIAINGVPFRMINTVAKILDGYEGVKDVTTTIFRDGRLVDIKMDVARMQDSGKGGQMSATSVLWE